MLVGLLVCWLGCQDDRGRGFSCHLDMGSPSGLGFMKVELPGEFCLRVVFGRGWGVGLVAGWMFFLGAVGLRGDDQPTGPCRIEVLEKGSGWPVPLVELRTTHQLRFVTDNAGVIAFDAQELMGREVWFDVFGQGME